MRKSSKGMVLWNNYLFYCVMATSVLTVCYGQTADTITLRQGEADPTLRSRGLKTSFPLERERLYTRTESGATEGSLTQNGSLVFDSNYHTDHPASKHFWHQLMDARLERMGPSVQCTDDAMTLRVRGVKAPHLLVNSGEGSLTPLTQMPSHCGFSVSRTRRDLRFVAPYQGCHVTQQGGHYVLPLSLWGSPMRMSCPVAPPPITISCFLNGMVLKLGGVTADALKVKVSGIWEPLRSCHCGFAVETLSGGPGLSLTAPYGGPCMEMRNNEHLLLLLVAERQLAVSCPSAPESSAPQPAKTTEPESKDPSPVPTPKPTKGTPPDPGHIVQMPPPYPQMPPPYPQMPPPYPQMPSWPFPQPPYPQSEKPGTPAASPEKNPKPITPAATPKPIPPKIVDPVDPVKIPQVPPQYPQMPSQYSQMPPPYPQMPSWPFPQPPYPQSEKPGTPAASPEKKPKPITPAATPKPIPPKIESTPAGPAQIPQIPPQYPQMPPQYPQMPPQYPQMPHYWPFPQPPNPQSEKPGTPAASPEKKPKPITPAATPKPITPKIVEPVDPVKIPQVPPQYHQMPHYWQFPPSPYPQFQKPDSPAASPDKNPKPITPAATPKPIPPKIESTPAEPVKIPQMPSQYSQMPPQYPQIPPQYPQMAVQIPQMPPQYPQMPPQYPQMPPQYPQIPPQYPQMAVQIPQIPPQYSQMPLYWPFPQPPYPQSEKPGTPAASPEKNPKPITPAATPKPIPPKIVDPVDPVKIPQVPPQYHQMPSQYSQMPPPYPQMPHYWQYPPSLYPQFQKPGPPAASPDKNPKPPKPITPAATPKPIPPKIESTPAEPVKMPSQYSQMPPQYSQMPPQYPQIPPQYPQIPPQYRSSYWQFPPSLYPQFQKPAASPVQTPKPITTAATPKPIDTNTPKDHDKFPEGSTAQNPAKGPHHYPFPYAGFNPPQPGPYYYPLPYAGFNPAQPVHKSAPVPNAPPAAPQAFPGLPLWFHPGSWGAHPYAAGHDAPIHSKTPKK